MGETLALRAFLRAQRRQLCYMYCSTIIYIIYLIGDTRGFVVRGTGNAKYEN